MRDSFIFWGTTVAAGDKACHCCTGVCSTQVVRKASQTGTSRTHFVSSTCVWAEGSWLPNPWKQALAGGARRGPPVIQVVQVMSTWVAYVPCFWHQASVWVSNAAIRQCVTVNACYTHRGDTCQATLAWVVNCTPVYLQRKSPKYDGVVCT